MGEFCSFRFAQLSSKITHSHSNTDGTIFGLIPQLSNVYRGPTPVHKVGLLLQQLKRDVEAEAALLGALEIEPDNLDYLYAAADHYLKRGKLVKAREVVEQMIEKHPRNTIGHDILNNINKRMAEKHEP